jgi:hypothetical protein
MHYSTKLIEGGKLITQRYDQIEIHALCQLDKDAKFLKTVILLSLNIEIKNLKLNGKFERFLFHLNLHQVRKAAKVVIVIPAKCSRTWEVLIKSSRFSTLPKASYFQESNKMIRLCIIPLLKSGFSLASIWIRISSVP